jgi:hypothetical protein
MEVVKGKLVVVDTQFPLGELQQRVTKLVPISVQINLSYVVENKG